jgi:hypothetical protein
MVIIMTIDISVNQVERVAGNAEVLYSPSPGCPARKRGEEWREATAA